MQSFNTAPELILLLLSLALTALAVQVQPTSNNAYKSSKSYIAMSSNSQEHSGGFYTKHALVQEF